MKKKYYRKFTPREIEVLKEKRLQKEALREQIEDKSLIELRRKYFVTTKEEVKLRNKLMQFNDYLTRKKTEDISKIIKYWISSF